MSVDFCAENIKKYLPSGFDRLIFFDEIDSTNEFCKRNSLPDGTYVISASQSGGKGRMGRRFESKQGGIFLSCVMTSRLSPDRLSCVTGMAAVAAVRAIKDAAGIDCGVKWVNDILLSGKKIGGILCEPSFEGDRCSVTLGIGLNVNNPVSDFDWDDEKKAGSLQSEAGKSFDLSCLAASLVRHLEVLRHDVEDGEISRYVTEYRQICTTLGRSVSLLWRDGSNEFSQSGERSVGYAKDISDTFGLIVEYPDGICEELRSGEVSARGEDGKYQ